MLISGWGNYPKLESKVIKAKSVVDSLVPVDKDGDGIIDIVEPDPLGLKTIRSYIYRYEEY